MMLRLRIVYLGNGNYSLYFQTKCEVPGLEDDFEILKLTCTVGKLGIKSSSTILILVLEDPTYTIVCFQLRSS